MKTEFISARKKRTRTYLFLVMIPILFLISGTVIWYQVVRERIFPKRWGAVEKNWVYRSGRLSPSLLERTLKFYKIKHIVNLCGSKKFPASQFEREIA